MSQPQDWHPLHPGDTRTRANIKIHIIQDRQGRALSPPPPPRLHSNSAALSIPRPCNATSERGAQAGAQNPWGCFLRVPGLHLNQPADLTILGAAEGARTEPWSCHHPAVTLAKLPCQPSALISKGHTTRNERAGKKGARRRPWELGHGPTQTSRQKAASHSGHYSEPSPHSLPHMAVGPT